jgi:hypothetical protein
MSFDKQPEPTSFEKGTLDPRIYQRGNRMYDSSSVTKSNIQMGNQKRANAYNLPASREKSPFLSKHAVPNSYDMSTVSRHFSTGVNPHNSSPFQRITAEFNKGSQENAPYKGSIFRQTDQQFHSATRDDRFGLVSSSSIVDDSKRIK